MSDERCLARTAAGKQCKGKVSPWSGDPRFCLRHGDRTSTIHEAELNQRLTEDRQARIEEAAALRREEKRTGRGTVYRHFDANGDLLYVGMSRTQVERALSHLNREWGIEVVRVEIEHHPSLGSAELAEAIAIRDENPRFNISRPLNGSHTGRTVPDDGSSTGKIAVS